MYFIAAFCSFMYLTLIKFIFYLNLIKLYVYIFNVKHQEQLRWCGAIQIPTLFVVTSDTGGVCVYNR